MPRAVESTGPGTGAEPGPEPAGRNSNSHSPGFGCVYLTCSVREAALASALAAPARICICHAAGLGEARRLLTLTWSRVLLTDAVFEGGDWKDALQMTVRMHPATALVVASPWADERFWLDVLERGAYDLILNPFRAEELRRVLENAHRHATAGGLRYMTA